MAKTMKALMKKERAPGLTLTEVEIPEIGPNDVLIKITKTAICGTDLHIYNWDEWSQKTIPVPMVTGHEYVGVIDKMGSAVKGFKVGDRVSGEGHLTCGTCRNCRAGTQHLCRNTYGVGVNRQGCFAEYLAIPAVNVFKIADDISDNLASIFDPYGNAAHTALSFDMVGEDILITGAGPIGCMAAAISRHVGARHVVVTDINEYRLELAKKLGATRVVNVLNEKLEDVMEELVGEIRDEHDHDRNSEFVQREDGSWLVDGSLAVDDLFGRMALPDPGGSRDYSTFSGLVLDELEKIPSVGDAFRWNGLLIEVVDMDGRRIDRLLVQRVSSDGK